mmetsp:Transcript_77884/g.208113  ORF Transcript_77884/g.208113 Transcript_77884/m.208113 type:complete len:338 (-) Transcript_77884:1225-2238(-)
MPLVILQFANLMEQITTTSMKISTSKDAPRLSAFTTTFSCSTMVKHSQGRGSPTSTSKMLLPMEEETAMSPSPCLATITEESKSGTEVPAASTVSPATATGTPRELDTTVAQSTMQKEKIPIQTMAPRNPATPYCTFWRSSRRTSGRVAQRHRTRGRVTMYHTRPRRPSGKSKGSIASAASCSFCISSFLCFQNRLSRYQVSKSSLLIVPFPDLSSSEITLLMLPSMWMFSLSKRFWSSVASMQPLPFSSKVWNARPISAKIRVSDTTYHLANSSKESFPSASQSSSSMTSSMFFGAGWHPSLVSRPATSFFSMYPLLSVSSSSKLVRTSPTTCVTT